MEGQVQILVVVDCIAFHYLEFELDGWHCSPCWDCWVCRRGQSGAVPVVVVVAALPFAVAFGQGYPLPREEGRVLEAVAVA